MMMMRIAYFMVTRNLRSPFIIYSLTGSLGNPTFTPAVGSSGELPPVVRQDQDDDEDSVIPGHKPVMMRIA
jgi:hypothetical protein